MAAREKCDENMMSVNAILRQLSQVLCKIDRFSSADCRIINNHEGQEASSQKGTCHALSDLWRGAGREVRTQHRTAPNNAAS